MKTWRSGQAGFTLLEVMIAVAILAVSLTALLNMQSQAALASLRAQRTGIATLLGRMKMEQLLLELEEGIKKGEFPDEKEDSGTFEEEKYPDYSWQLKIRKVEIPPPPATDETMQLMESIFKLISEQISQSTREVKLVILFQEPGASEAEEVMTLTTHIVNLKGGGVQLQQLETAPPPAPPAPGGGRTP